MENIDLIFAVGGAVSAITVGFFGWIISIIKSQNRLAVHALKDQAEQDKEMSSKLANIDKLLENHEIKIKHAENEIDGIGSKLESVQLDLGEMKSWIKEESMLIRETQNSIRDIKDTQKTLDQKLDLLIIGRGAKN